MNSHTPDKTESSSQQSPAAAACSEFDLWWYNVGSGLPPLPEEDAETHVRRVCKIAWLESLKPKDT